MGDIQGMQELNCRPDLSNNLSNFLFGIWSTLLIFELSEKVPSLQKFNNYQKASDSIESVLKNVNDRNYVLVMTETMLMLHASGYILPG